MKATTNLYADVYYRKLHGEQYSKDEYLRDQQANTKKYAFDDETASLTLVPGLPEILRRTRCPVLAIFGERDSQVDWRRTAAFYRDTIRTSPKSELTIRTFPDCGHALLKCRTCGVDQDDLKEFNYQPCDGYWDAIAGWLRQHGFAR